MKREGDFRLFGLFGYPLSHTLSPVMQETAFSHLGIKAYYLIFELDPAHFRKAMSDLSRFLLDGFNVTVPYKEKVIPYLDELTPKAKAVRAVNTVFRRGKKWIGTNTDIDGFLASLHGEGRFRPKGKEVLLLGAGGGARAVAYGLAGKGVKRILITDKLEEKVKAVIRDLKPLFPRTEFRKVPCSGEAWKEILRRGVHLVVNATAVGLKPKDPSLLSPSWVPSASRAGRILFYDLIYRPAVTPFLRVGKRKGHRILNGFGMLLHQGGRAFECWTGKRAPVQVMKKTLVKALKGSRN